MYMPIREIKSCAIATNTVYTLTAATPLSEKFSPGYLGTNFRSANINITVRLLQYKARERPERKKLIKYGGALYAEHHKEHNEATRRIQAEMWIPGSK